MAACERAVSHIVPALMHYVTLDAAQHDFGSMPVLRNPVFVFVILYSINTINGHFCIAIEIKQLLS